MKSLSPLRVSLWVLVAGMAFFVMAASSPQCARSDDRALNPSFETQGDAIGFCVQICIDDFQAAKKVEQARHKAAMRACNADPVCQYEESWLHDMIVLELVAIKDACIVACEHQQGAAAGGQ